MANEAVPRNNSNGEWAVGGPVAAPTRVANSSSEALANEAVDVWRRNGEQQAKWWEAEAAAKESVSPKAGVGGKVREAPAAGEIPKTSATGQSARHGPDVYAVEAAAVPVVPARAAGPTKSAASDGSSSFPCPLNHPNGNEYIFLSK